MAARTKSKITPKYKTKYRVKNWRAYEAALRKRGDITVWFGQDAIDAWNAPPGGRPGGQHRYSDLAIVTALTLRAVFHLPLRQTEGFVASLIRIMRLDLETPDHTTLSRRSATVEVPEWPRAERCNNALDRDLLTERIGQLPPQKLQLVFAGIDLVLGRVSTR